MTRLRVEDALTIIVAAAFIGYAGVGGAFASIHLDEEQLWVFSFILLPVSVIIFISSLRYALGGAESSASRLVADVVVVVRDWLPFALFLLFYMTFDAHVWFVIQPHDRDAALLATDRFLFGGTPSVWMESWISDRLTNVLAFCYFLHLVLPPVVAALWYRRNLKVFREFLLAVLVAGIIASFCYFAVPAVGPGFAFPQLFSKALHGKLYRPLIDAMEVARAPRDVFPSLHVAISGLVLWYGARRGKAVFVCLLPFVIGNWVSTMYLRYHYLIDVLAGLVLVPLTIFVTQKLLALEARLTSAPTDCQTT